jgi:hypothetical protein
VTLLLAVVALTSVVPGFLYWVISRLVRVRLAEVRVFYGPQIASFGANPKVSVGALPFGAHARLHESELPPAPSVRAGALCVALALYAPLYYGCVAALCLGTRGAFDSMLSAWLQFFDGAIFPFVAREHVAQWIGIDSIRIAVGTLFAKFASLGFLPLPASSLGQALIDGVYFRGKPTAIHGGPLLVSTILSIVLMVVCVFMWGLALARVLIGM